MKYDDMRDGIDRRTTRAGSGIRPKRRRSWRVRTPWRLDLFGLRAWWEAGR